MIEDYTSPPPGGETIHLTQELPPPLPEDLPEIEEPTEDQSDDKLHSSTPSDEDSSQDPRAEDSEDDYNSALEDEDVIYTQPEVIPTPVNTPGIPSQSISEVEMKIHKVYGLYVRQNDGTDLNGGIKDDAIWQAHWKKIVSLPPQRYDVPSGKVGKVFIHMLANELLGTIDRKWN